MRQEPAAQEPSPSPSALPSPGGAAGCLPQISLATRAGLRVGVTEEKQGHQLLEVPGGGETRHPQRRHLS